MKKHCISLLIVFALSMWGFDLRAQNVKIGVVDRQYVYSTLAAAGSQVEEKNSQQGLLSDMKTLDKNLGEKRAAYEEVRKKGDMASMASLDKESRQLLGSMEAKRKELARRQADLIRSRETRVTEAIKAVAVERGYTSVLDVSAVPFFSEEDNISLLVLQKLGVAK